MAVSFLLMGFLVYALFVPHLVMPFGSGAPDIHVPSMRNVPENPGALRLDVQDPDGEQSPPRPH